MPSNLSNTLASFQDHINEILMEKQDFFVLVYLDHILIYDNKIDHIDAIGKFFI